MPTTIPAVASPLKPHPSSHTMGKLLLFFVPLGFAAALVSVTHTIIHATLSKAPHPEIAIAAYAIGASFLLFSERPAILVRQTCSALVRDRQSFRAMSGVTWILIGAVIMLGAVVCYTPIGAFIFRELYGADEALVPSIIAGYQFFMWVSAFSALRCLYHGVIITQMRTKWVTIAMVIRLFGMLALSQYLIRTGQVDSGAVGALLFAVGMSIEAVVCYAEGRTLVRRMPERKPGYTVSTKQILGFYRPLLYSSFFVMAVQPVINALLGKTMNIELSIASFAVATSVFNVVVSMFTYIHQIVLNFYQSSPGLVLRFQWIAGFAPCAMMALLCWSPAGTFLLEEWMGLSGQLLTETLKVMKIFVLLGALFPWVDFGNGFLMLFRRTGVFLWSQSTNAFVAISLLVLLVAVAPQWNGMIGALAISAGAACELVVVFYALYRGSTGGMRWRKARAADD